MTARGEKRMTNHPVKSGQGMAPTQPVFMETKACKASTTPVPPSVQAPFLTLDFLLKQALMWEGMMRME